MFDGEDALGQVVDDVAGQSAQPQTGDSPRPGIPEGGRAGGRRNESVGAGLFRPADRRRLDEAARFHDQDLPAPRSPPRRPAHPPRRRRQLLGVDRRHDAVHRQQPRAAARRRFLAGALPAEDSNRRGGGAVERHPGGARSAPGPGRRHDQGLRAGRAARGGVSADGDPRRPRQALHRLQYRPLGLHQQRLGRDGVGSAVHQPEHRHHHDDLRLHARLRGPRPARLQHAGSTRPAGAVAGRDGAQHPGRIDAPASTPA